MPAKTVARQTIKVQVKLWGWLDVALPNGQAILDLPVGTTTAGVLDHLGVPAGPCFFSLNGEQASYMAVLHEGDRLDIALMASGG
jgi:sulfur carrier protein ThiS